MEQVLYYAGVAAGLLVLVVGFGFHWIGQVISVTNRPLAIRLGIWEKDNLPEYEAYENAIAVADVAIGWTYGVAGVGLLLGAPWGYMLAWIPGVVLVYHSISFWFWTGNQEKAGHPTMMTRNPARAGWFLANLVTGLLAIVVAICYSLQ